MAASGLDRVEAAPDGSELVEGLGEVFRAAHVADAGPRGRLHVRSYRAGLRFCGQPGRSVAVAAEGLRLALSDECAYLDERLLLPARSDTIRAAWHGGQVAIVCKDGATFQLPASDCISLPVSRITLEELAAFLWERVVETCTASLLEQGVVSGRVIVWEEPLRSASFGKSLSKEPQGPPAAPKLPSDKLLPIRQHVKRVVLLTGASRGYGRALAVALAAEAVAAGRPTHLVLVARDEAGLRETADAATSSGVSHHCMALDLAGRGDLSQRLEPLLAHLEAETSHGGPAELLILHNAGSLGPLLYCRDISASDTQLAIDLNVTSFAVLNNALLRRFASAASSAGGTGLRVRIVNISSLLAVEAFPSWSLYAMGKAARDMAMRAVAKDAQAEGLDVRTLSWAPGPMRTAMTEQILGTCADPTVVENFRKLDREGSFVPMDASAGKLLKLLAEDSYENGAHVDFFDV